MRLRDNTLRSFTPCTRLSRCCTRTHKTRARGTAARCAHGATCAQHSARAYSSSCSGVVVDTMKTNSRAPSWHTHRRLRMLISQRRRARGAHARRCRRLSLTHLSRATALRPALLVVSWTRARLTVALAHVARGTWRGSVKPVSEDRQHAGTARARRAHGSCRIIRASGLARGRRQRHQRTYHYQLRS